MSDPEAPDRGDRAPGDERSARVTRAIVGYLVGLGLAALLTVASFLTVNTSLIWAPAIPVALLVFAVAQMGVHLVFFLHLTTGPDNTNNAIALAFGVMVVFLLLTGSIWIMAHLNAQMMPMDQLIRMQR